MFIPTLSTTATALQYMLQKPPERGHPPEPDRGTSPEPVAMPRTEAEERPAPHRGLCRCLVAG